MRLYVFAMFAAAAWAQSQAPAPDPELMKKAAEAAKAAVEGQKAPGTAPVQVTVPIEGGTQELPLGALSNILTMPPGTLVATIDGVKVTAADLQTILRALPPQAQQAALKNRRQFLEQYGVMMRLSAEAEKAKLDQQTPWKEQLSNMRMQMLAQAEINQRLNEIQVPVEEQRKQYDAHKDRYEQAKVKAIYIPFSTAPVSKPDAEGKPVLTEEQAKAKAEDLVKQLRAGADFVKLVKENSGDPTSAKKDGDFGAIKRTDPIPQAVKTAIFAAKPGEVTDPVRQASGFYIFRIEEIGPQPFEQVQGRIADELRNAQFSEWLSALQRSVDIKEASITMSMEVRKPSHPPASPAPAAPEK
jgi:peptidyl-prolyl cis-trans isomerase C